MTSSKIFIEQHLKPELPLIDRKKELIENQRITTKRRRSHTSWKSRALTGEKRGLLAARVLRIKKSSLLLLCSTFMILFSLTPLLVRFNTFLWEKKRVLHEEDDILYNLFLLEGVRPGTQETTADVTDRDPLATFRVGTYRIQSGDSLWSISRKFNLSIDALLTANKVKNVHYLNVGEELRIPNISGVFYRVQRGDNLSSIAQKYSVRVNDIADVNDLDSATIQVGQTLFIPGGSLNDWERASLMGTIFKVPVQGRVTSKLGFRIDPFSQRRAYHTGIDIANYVGTPVYASQYGRVVYTGYKGNYGKTVIIAHPEGYRTLYAHLHKIYVKRGQAVRQGEKIGLLGNTGRSTGPHLHFEIQQNRKILDPLKVMRMKK